MEKQGIYAYAVVGNRQPKMDDIFLVNYKDLTLIGKMINIADFQKELQEALKNPKTMEAILTGHQGFLDRLMRKTTVVPFQFGTILKTKEAAVDHLKSFYIRYKELLKKFKDKQEWGVRVFADLKKFRASTVQTNQGNTQRSTRSTLLRVDTERPSNVSRSGTAYLLRKKQEKEAEEAANEKLAFFSGEILSSLKELAFDHKVTKSAQRFSEKGELLISVFAFLILKSKTRKFGQKLESLRKKYQKSGLSLTRSGPWPAYNFVS